MGLSGGVGERLGALEAAARAATAGRWKLWGMEVLADQDGTSNVGERDVEWPCPTLVAIGAALGVEVGA